jgi:hypothetical protein
VAKPGEGGGFYSSGVLNYIGTSGLTTDPDPARARNQRPGPPPPLARWGW